MKFYFQRFSQALLQEIFKTLKYAESYQCTTSFPAYLAIIIHFLQLASTNIISDADFEGTGIDYYAVRVLKYVNIYRIFEFYVTQLDTRIYITAAINIATIIIFTLLAIMLHTSARFRLIQRTFGRLIGIYQQFFALIFLLPNLDIYLQGLISKTVSSTAIGFSVALVVWPIIFVLMVEMRHAVHTTYCYNSPWRQNLGPFCLFKLSLNIAVIIAPRIVERFSGGSIIMLFINIGLALCLLLLYLHEISHLHEMTTKVYISGFAIWFTYTGFVFAKKQNPDQNDFAYASIILMVLLGYALLKLLKIKIHAVMFAKDYLALDAYNFNWLFRKVQITLEISEQHNLVNQNMLVMFIENFFRQTFVKHEELVVADDKFFERNPEDKREMRKPAFIHNLKYLTHLAITTLYSKKIERFPPRRHDELSIPFIHFLIQHKKDLLRASQRISNLYFNKKRNASSLGIAEGFLMDRIQEILSLAIAERLNVRTAKELNVFLPFEYEDLFKSTKELLKELLRKYHQFYSLIRGKTIDLDQVQLLGTNLRAEKAQLERNISKLLEINPYSWSSHVLYKFCLQVEIVVKGVKNYRLHERLMLEHNVKGNQSLVDDLEQGIFNVLAYNSGIALMTLDDRRPGKVLKVTENFLKIFGYNANDMKNIEAESLMPIIFARNHKAVVHNRKKADHISTGMSKVTGVNKKGFLFPLNHFIKIIPYENELCAAGYFSPDIYDGDILLLDEWGYLTNYTAAFHNKIWPDANERHSDKRPLYGLNLASIAPSLLIKLYGNAMPLSAKSNFSNFVQSQELITNENEMGYLLLPRLPERLDHYQKALQKSMKIHNTYGKTISPRAQSERFHNIISVAQSFLEDPRLMLLQIEYRVSEFRISIKPNPIGYYIHITDINEIKDPQVIGEYRDKHLQLYNSFTGGFSWLRQLLMRNPVSKISSEASSLTETTPKNVSPFLSPHTGFPRILTFKNFSGQSKKETTRRSYDTERLNTGDNLITKEEEIEESIDQEVDRNHGNCPEEEHKDQHQNFVFQSSRNLFLSALKPQTGTFSHRIEGTQELQSHRKLLMSEADDLREHLADIPLEVLVDEFTRRGYSILKDQNTLTENSHRVLTSPKGPNANLNSFRNYSQTLGTKQSELFQSARIMLLGDEADNIDDSGSASPLSDNKGPRKPTRSRVILRSRLIAKSTQQGSSNKRTELNGNYDETEKQKVNDLLEIMERSSYTSSVTSNTSKMASIYHAFISSKKTPSYLTNLHIFGTGAFIVIGTIMLVLFVTLHSLLRTYRTFVEIADYTCPFTSGMAVFLYNTEKIIMQNNGVFNYSLLDASYIYSYANMLNEQSYTLYKEKYQTTMEVTDIEDLSASVSYNDYLLPITQYTGNGTLDVQKMEYFGAVERMQGIMYDYLVTDYSTINASHVYAIYFRENFDNYFSALTQVTSLLFQELYGESQTIDVQKFSIITMSVNLSVLFLFILTLYPIYRKNENKIIRMLSLFGTYPGPDIEEKLAKIDAALLKLESTHEDAMADLLHRKSSIRSVTKVSPRKKNETTQVRRSFSEWRKKRYSVIRFVFYLLVAFGVGAAYIISSSLMIIVKNQGFLPILSEYDLSTDTWSFIPVAFAVTFNVLGRYPEAIDQNATDAIIDRHSGAYERLQERRSNMNLHFGDEFNTFMEEAYLEDSYQIYMTRLRRENLCDLLDEETDLVPANITECKALMNEIASLGLTHVVLQIFDLMAYYRTYVQNNGLTKEAVEHFVNTQEFYELDRMLFYVDRVMRSWMTKQHDNLSTSLNDQIDTCIIVFVVGICLIILSYVGVWIRFIRAMKTQFLKAKELFDLLPYSMIVQNYHVKKFLKDLSAANI